MQAQTTHRLTCFCPAPLQAPGIFSRLLGRKLALAPRPLVELRLGGHDVAAGGARPRREVAGEAAARRVREQEQPFALGVVTQPLLDRGDRAGDAVGAHAVGHGVDVGLDRRIDLAELAIIAVLGRPARGVKRYACGVGVCASGTSFNAPHVSGSWATSVLR